MMITHLHVEMALQLIAMAAGLFLLMKSCGDVCCKFLYKLFGYLVVIISLLMIVCTVYRGVDMWRMGGMKMMPGMHHRMMEGMDPGMMQKMMGECPCPMMQMMKEKMGEEAPKK